MLGCSRTYSERRGESMFGDTSWHLSNWSSVLDTLDSWLARSGEPPAGELICLDSLQIYHLSGNIFCWFYEGCCGCLTARPEEIKATFLQLEVHWHLNSQLIFYHQKWNWNPRRSQFCQLQWEWCLVVAPLPHQNWRQPSSWRIEIDTELQQIRYSTWWEVLEMSCVESWSGWWWWMIAKKWQRGSGMWPRWGCSFWPPKFKMWGLGIWRENTSPTQNLEMKDE